MTKEEAFEKYWGEVMALQRRIAEAFPDDPYGGAGLVKFTGLLKNSFRECWLEACRQARLEALQECFYKVNRRSLMDAEKVIRALIEAEEPMP